MFCCPLINKVTPLVWPSNKENYEMVNENDSKIFVSYFVSLKRAPIEQEIDWSVIVFRASFLTNINVPLTESSVGSTIALDVWLWDKRN